MNEKSFLKQIRRGSNPDSSFAKDQIVNSYQEEQGEQKQRWTCETRGQKSTFIANCHARKLVSMYNLQQSFLTCFENVKVYYIHNQFIMTERGMFLESTFTRLNISNVQCKRKFLVHASKNWAFSL